MGRIPSASLIEGARFTATAGIPGVAQGLFRRRRRVARAASMLAVDGQVVGLLRGLRRAHAPGPVWIRVATNNALLLLSPGDVRRVLEGSPAPFASDPEPKRTGMAHFQPHALTISRGADWADRRRFTEAVLDTERERHRRAAHHLAVARDEVAALLGELNGHDATVELDFDATHRMLRRIARRIILGSRARDDEQLSAALATLMDEANGLPSSPSENFEPFMERVGAYLRAGEKDSLCALAARAPSSERTDPAGQLPHWLFAFADTLALNLHRALGLIAAHPAELATVREELGARPPASAPAVTRLRHLEACLQEAMRLYPTTPMLARETIADTDWDGERVPAGTQVLIVNTYHHRDPDHLGEVADRFTPRQWTEGTAAGSWAFNHFSRGPQGCPGARLALFTGTAVLAELLAAREPTLVAPRLDVTRPLPAMLDVFGLRVALRPRVA